MLEAKTVTLDPDHFEDSLSASERYDLNTLKLEIAAQFPKNAFNYRELGGTMQGAAAAPAAPYGTTQITNIGDLPAYRISSDKFQVFWTFDGSDPANPASTTRVAGPAFAESYNGSQIPIDLATYAPTGTATIRIKAVALDTELFRTSDEQVVTLGIEKLTLPATQLSVSNDQVIMATEPHVTRLPAGSRIFYTADGTDPGVNAGEPAQPGAQLYAAPIALPSRPH